jgi:colanic acid/amylovoran biosynthesis glycosyltransferase
MMEALSFGLVPAVTATRSGHDLLRDGENAVIAPERNIDALAARIATLAADPERHAQAARAARATAEQYLAELSYPERFASLIHSIAERELALCAS